MSTPHVHWRNFVSVSNQRQGLFRKAAPLFLITLLSGSIDTLIHAEQPSVKSPPDVSFRPLEQAIAQRQPAAIRSEVDRLLSRGFIPADTLMLFGVQLAQLEFYEEARQLFGRCAQDFPEHFEAHYNLALANLALQKKPEALAALQHAPQTSNAQRLACSYLQGKILQALGQLDQAERYLSMAFKEAPQQENYALDYGLFNLKRRNYLKAEEVFTQASAFHPRSSLVLTALSLAQLLAGRPLQAMESARKLLNMDPDFSPARLLLAFTLYLNGDLDEAQKAAAAALAKPNPHPYLYYLDASLLLKLQSKDYRRILNELAVAEQGIPSCSLCYLAEGKAQQALGALESAIKALEKAVQLDPEFSEAWYHLALVYGRAGKRQEAERARGQFSRLKTEKANREADLLRRLFLETLAGKE
jgi:tetratricopeptide (TPR) repeat protein